MAISQGIEKTGRLRRGYTTGSCAAAGAKAAAIALFAALKPARTSPLLDSVSVTLPSKAKAVLSIPVKAVIVSGRSATAVIVKDAGDDPDVTNGAEILTTVEFAGHNVMRTSVRVRGGQGVGTVTRPGLKIGVGKPAINPVPLQMIKAAVREAALEFGITPAVIVTVSVPKGMELAEKTLNPRLGIFGGISILGTTGIVEPMSLSAYRHSISCAVDVALASGCSEVVYSTGRTSEKIVMAGRALPEVAFVLTGDHMGFALRDAAGRKGLKTVTVAAQFGKMTKLAAGHFETHCSESSVEFEFIAGVCRKSGINCPDGFIDEILSANTARQVFFMLKKTGYKAVLEAVCSRARANAGRIIGGSILVRCILAGYNNEICCVSEP